MNELELNKKIGKILKHLRTKHNLSQLDIALQADLSTRHYQEIEYGKLKCQINTLCKIISVYNLNIFSFFTNFIMEIFYKDGVDILYHVFGDEHFGHRRFNLDGVATFQCKHSETITGMSNEEVVGKITIWHDLENENIKSFIQLAFRTFVKTMPKNGSWKINIKNHLNNTHKPFMGYTRFEKDLNGKTFGIEIIIFPI